MGDLAEVPAKTRNGLERVDKMPPDLRRCVHEFGLPIVDTCIQYGITQPSKIRHLVKEIWGGARESWLQKLSSYSGLVSKLDWYLAQSDGKINAATLLRLVNDHGFVVVPKHPWACMIKASMETVSNHDVTMTKAEKHRLRLIAAFEAAVKYAWPHLK